MPGAHPGARLGQPISGDHSSGRRGIHKGLPKGGSRQRINPAAVSRMRQALSRDLQKHRKLRKSWKYFNPGPGSLPDLSRQCRHRRRCCRPRRLARQEQRRLCVDSEIQARKHRDYRDHRARSETERERGLQGEVKRGRPEALLLRTAIEMCAGR